MPAAKMSPRRRTSEEVAADRESAISEIKALLKKHVPPFVARTDKKGGYLLYSEKEIDVDGRKKDEVFFAGMIPQKSYVGFYYMPVYTNPERKKLFRPELLKLLKGKSCFYVRKLGPAVKQQMKQALADGVKLYKQRGWV